MNPMLAHWNAMEDAQAAAAVLPCCGSTRWAALLAASRPIADEAALLSRAEEIWLSLDPPDWLEAFATHPRIGERKPQQQAARQSAAWSAQEQRGITDADAAVRAALAEGNRLYEQRFARVFLVCASGKTAHEMLDMLLARLRNDEATELREAAGQQRQITALRLRRWMNS
jgi:2-oxo-4-hydroxy-4-carboxy-5-ureidoimidazoline decarboxylase